MWLMVENSPSPMFQRQGVDYAFQVKFADVAGCDGAKQELVAQLPIKHTSFNSFQKISWEGLSVGLCGSQVVH